MMKFILTLSLATFGVVVVLLSAAVVALAIARQHQINEKF